MYIANESLLRSLTAVLITVNSYMQTSTLRAFLFDVSFMGGGGEEDDKKKDSKFWKNETINVFSIASGHLYERFLRYSISQPL